MTPAGSSNRPGTLAKRFTLPEKIPVAIQFYFDVVEFFYFFIGEVAFGIQLFFFGNKLFDVLHYLVVLHFYFD